MCFHRSSFGPCNIWRRGALTFGWRSHSDSGHALDRAVHVGHHEAKHVVGAAVQFCGECKGQGSRARDDGDDEGGLTMFKGSSSARQQRSCVYLK